MNDSLREALEWAAKDAHVGWMLFESERGPSAHAKEFDDCQVAACADRRAALAAEYARDNRRVASCPGCRGRRWTEDENWQQDDPRHPRERTPGAGLIPCGFCNEAGWDVAQGTPLGYADALWLDSILMRYVNRPFDQQAAIQCREDIRAALAASRLDVPSDLRERNRLYPHPHIPLGACRICAALERLAASPEGLWTELQRENERLRTLYRECTEQRLAAPPPLIQLDIERLAQAACIEAESIESDPVEFNDCPDRAEHIDYVRTLMEIYEKITT